MNGPWTDDLFLHVLAPLHTSTDQRVTVIIAYIAHPTLSPALSSSPFQVYEQCVREASFDTPFSGAPPSQLLHTIARACKRVYKDEWTYSLHQTRIKVAELAKRKLAEDDLLWESHQAAGGSADGSSNMLDATPRPAESDMDATVSHRLPPRH